MSYERRVYQSVDDGRLSWRFSQKSRKKNSGDIRLNIDCYKNKRIQVNNPNNIRYLNNINGNF